VTYPEPIVRDYINEHFIPWNIDVTQDLARVRRFDIFTTPTLIFADSKGREFYRGIGYLPPRRFMGRLIFGEAWVMFRTRRYQDAGDLFATVAQHYPECSTAAESIFFRGVARDKISDDHNNRIASAHELADRYPNSDWTFGASVWLEGEPE
jgi:hypothetical protein